MDSIDLALLHGAFLAMLHEDIGTGDITSQATVTPTARASGRYTTKQPLVLAGIPVVQEIVGLVDAQLEFKTLARDGDSVASGTALAEICGSARSILAVERTSLNLLQRMCGIATMTRRYVDRVKGRAPESWIHARLLPG